MCLSGAMYQDEQEYEFYNRIQLHNTSSNIHSTVMDDIKKVTKRNGTSIYIIPNNG